MGKLKFLIMSFSGSHPVSVLEHAQEPTKGEKAGLQDMAISQKLRGNPACNLIILFTIWLFDQIFRECPISRAEVNLSGI
jgi:hypothetical protein